MSVDVLSASEHKERCGSQSEEENDIVEQQGSRSVQRRKRPSRVMRRLMVHAPSVTSRNTSVQYLARLGTPRYWSRFVSSGKYADGSSL